MKKQFRDFESAREFVRSLNLTSRKKWYEYCKSGNKPNYIPYTPSTAYKNKGWTGWGDFLGTGIVAKKDKKFCSYKEARLFVRKLGLKSARDWYEYYKSGNKPDDVPSAPQGTYKNKGWTGWGDFLGTGRTRDWRSFEEARKFVRKLKLKNIGGWRQFTKSKQMPNDIPVNPDTTYTNEFKGYGDFLGTGRVASQDKVYRSFIAARDFVRKLNLKSGKEWNDYCKSGEKPDDIPAAPWSIYKEWKKI